MRKGRIEVDHGPRTTEHAHIVCVRQDETCIVWYSLSRTTPCRTSLNLEQLANARLYESIHQALSDYMRRTGELNSYYHEALELANWLFTQHQVALQQEAQARTRRKIEDRLRKDPQFVEAIAYLIGLTS